MDRGPTGRQGERRPKQQSEQAFLADVLRANRPGLVTPEVYAVNRGIDVVIGLLLIANYLRTVGVFIGEDGAVSFSVAGPLSTRRILEAIFNGDFMVDGFNVTPRG